MMSRKQWEYSDIGSLFTARTMKKSGIKEAFSNWSQTLKVFSKETMAEAPSEFFMIEEEDHPDETQIQYKDEFMMWEFKIELRMRRHRWKPGWIE